MPDHMIIHTIVTTGLSLWQQSMGFKVTEALWHLLISSLRPILNDYLPLQVIYIITTTHTKIV